MHEPSAAIALGDQSTPQESRNWRPMAVAFTGSGWEYLRIWLVNLVLILLTLGVYWPWARVRKLRYIYANTSIDGDALSYHASGWQLFKGMVIAGVLFGLTNLIGQLNLWAAVASVLMFGLLLPWLWFNALRFRLNQTSWRGVRFAFTATLGGAYRAMVGGYLLVTVAVIGLGLSLSLVEGNDASALTMTLLAALASAIVYLANSLALLWLRRYQHNHYALGNLGVQMQVSLAQVLHAGWVASLLFGAIFSGLVFAGIAGLFDAASLHPEAALGLLVMGMIVVGLLLPLVMAYVSARYQNLFWGATANVQLRVHSALSPGRLVALVAVNLVLTLLTLGLYWPFAQMKVLRLRLGALSLDSQVDWAQVQATAQSGTGSMGDMALEVQGVDFGF